MGGDTITASAGSELKLGGTQTGTAPLLPGASVDEARKPGDEAGESCALPPIGDSTACDCGKEAEACTSGDNGACEDITQSVMRIIRQYMQYVDTQSEASEGLA